MNAPEKQMFLPDVQATADSRDIAIQRVGVKSIVFPLTIAGSADGKSQALSTVANIDMYVGLKPEVKGTHMSRFLELLHDELEPVSCLTLQSLLVRMLERLEAGSGYIEMRMPYFIRKIAPVSGVASLMDYQVTYKAEQKQGQLSLTLQVLVPVTSLCPCSKKISLYGAHNQRSHVTIAAMVAPDSAASLSVEALVGYAEQAASCELYGLLKRPDEKYVTERAYENPKFVEDLVRDISVALNHDDRVLAYTVESENFESIHNHSAYALVEHDKRAG